MLVINTSMKNLHQETINIDTAAKFLGLSETSLKRLHRMGEGPISNRVGNTLVYCEGSLRDWALMKGRGVASNILS